MDMAYSGQTVTNPVTTEEITFLETARDREGERLLFDCRVGLNGAVLPAHIHATQEERLEVVEGTLGVMLGDGIYTLRVGQSIAMPANVKHQWWNAGNDDLLIRVEVVPPRQLEAVLETVSGMAHEGKLRRNGMPKDVFAFVDLLRASETYAPGVPRWMQWTALRIAGAIGRMLGYDAAFTRYQTHGPELVSTGTDRHDAA
jgi:quercetin dioxygenase-like cupin family protein